MSIKGCNSVANLPKFQLIQVFMHVLVTCKNEEDPIQFNSKKGARVFTKFSHLKSMGIFLDAQGQLALQSMVVSGQISNSSKTLWLFSLPAKMKKI